MGEVKPVLYHLPDIITAKIHGDAIYVCEGEKDADSAFLYFGTPGTTNIFGAGKWKPEYSESLRGCNVVVIPDNDPAGQTHCTQVCASLYKKTKSLKVWHVPSPHKDFTEWLESQND
jgi:DNA primase